MHAREERPLDANVVLECCADGSQSAYIAQVHTLSEVTHT